MESVNFMAVIKEDMITVQVPKDLWAKVLTMVQGGVFDIPYGRATLNFAEGQIASIMVEKRTYDRKETLPRRDIHSRKLGPP